MDWKFNFWSVKGLNEWMNRFWVSWRIEEIDGFYGMNGWMIELMNKLWWIND